MAIVLSILKCMFYSRKINLPYRDGVGPSSKRGGGGPSKSATVLECTDTSDRFDSPECNTIVRG